MKRTLTVCPYCGTGCMFYLVSDGGRLVGVEPSVPHPVNRGSLCVKGWNAYAFVHHPDRLTTPLVRRNGDLLPASWDAAIGTAVTRLREIQARHGADSIMFASSAKATNEENYLFMKLARAVFGTNNMDHCARLCHSSTVVGLAETFGSGAMTNSIDCIDRAALSGVTVRCENSSVISGITAPVPAASAPQRSCRRVEPRPLRRGRAKPPPAEGSARARWPGTPSLA